MSSLHINNRELKACTTADKTPPVESKTNIAETETHNTLINPIFLLRELMNHAVAALIQIAQESKENKQVIQEAWKCATKKQENATSLGQHGTLLQGGLLAGGMWAENAQNFYNLPIQSAGKIGKELSKSVPSMVQAYDQQRSIRPGQESQQYGQDYSQIGGELSSTFQQVDAAFGQANQLFQIAARMITGQSV